MVRDRKLIRSRLQPLLVRSCGWLFLWLLLACSTNDGRFHLEGSLKGFNQGELFLYSPDGVMSKMDTIKVLKGAFTWDRNIETDATFFLVFPNFTEIPIFATHGAELEIQGDASHLKEIIVEGTPDNEQLTAFRLKTSQQTPVEVKREAADFVRQNPTARCARYLIDKYFIQAAPPDYGQAITLLQLIQKAQPENKELKNLIDRLQGLKNSREKSRIPAFTAIDMNGKRYSDTNLSAPVNLIITWATWNYQSQSYLRQLRMLQRDYGAHRLRILSFCVDANKKECRRILERDSISWTNICDGLMWKTPALDKLGLNSVPDNIIVNEKGIIVARSLDFTALRNKLEALLK